MRLIILLIGSFITMIEIILATQVFNFNPKPNIGSILFAITFISIGVLGTLVFKDDRTPK